MILLFAVLALGVAADGRMDVPPPVPIATELATTFAGAIRRNPAFAAAKGRVIQPGMQGFLPADAPFPTWIVEFRWQENAKLRTGMTFLIDVPAAEKVTPGIEKQTLAMREGPWIAAKVFEDQTYAMWAAETQQQRRANNEAMTAGDIRSVISAEAAFMSESGGSFGELRCLKQPADCLPGSKTPPLLDAERYPADRHGYRRTFHPGAAVKGKGKQTGLLATFAYSAAPMEPKYGSRAICGDSTGNVCAVAAATMPTVVGGACPKSCLPLE
jgi:hypothetical protein